MKGECTLKGIEIKNFRSLKDTGILNLSPITVLVGENSSGKSTFLRAFPLIKQSISKRTSGPLLWAGDVDDYVDFGSFEETVTNDGSDTISFKFLFPLTFNSFKHSIFINHSSIIDDEEHFQVEYQLTVTSSGGKDYVSAVGIKINETLANWDLLRPNIQIDSIPVHFDLLDNEYIEITDETGKPIRMRGFINSDAPSSSIFGFRLPSLSSVWNDLCDYFSIKEDSQRYGFELAIFQESIRIVGELLCLGKSLSESLSIIRKRTSSKVYYSDISLRAGKIMKELTSSRKFDRSKYEALIKLCFIYSAFSQIEEYVSTYFRQVHYIAPLRATAERYYRLRNLAVDEVDYQGKNLAIYLNSLSNQKLSDFHKWTTEHFGFKIITNKDKGHLSLKITLRNSKKAINLSDTGFGYSQILPIITQLWELSSRKQTNNNQEIPLVIAIEQPELHLHPAVQAKLANAFIASIQLAKENGYNMQLILETHSETIVNHFGKAIAKDLLKPEDISVILFEKQLGSTSTQVKTSGFDKYGYLLDNWPYGFFAPGE